MRIVVLTRDNWTCRYCGAWADEIDHVVRVRDGGSDELDNLVAACRQCNAARELPRSLVERAQRFLNPTSPETRPVSGKYLPETRGFEPIVGDYSRKP